MSDFSAKTHIFLDYGLFDRLVAEKRSGDSDRIRDMPGSTLPSGRLGLLRGWHRGHPVSPLLSAEIMV